MGQVGRWIDGRTDEQRDRILRTDRWYGRDQLLDNRDRPRCLISAAHDWKSLTKAHSHNPRIANRYDVLCTRFGGDRIVRAVKLRAGAKVDDLAPTEAKATA